MNEDTRKRAFAFAAAAIVVAVVLTPRGIGSPDEPADGGADSHPAGSQTPEPDSPTGEAAGSGPLILGPDEAKPRRRAEVKPTLASPPLASAEASDPPNPTTGRESRHAARPVVMKFMRAYARYQAGELGRAVRRGLRTSAATTLYAELVGQPPRTPPGERQVAPRVRELRLYGPFDGRLKAIVMLARPGSKRDMPLELDLEQEAAGRWRVVELRPS